jgi:hypothetical protein
MGHGKKWKMEDALRAPCGDAVLHPRGTGKGNQEDRKSWKVGALCVTRLQ